VAGTVAKLVAGSFTIDGEEVVSQDSVAVFEAPHRPWRVNETFFAFDLLELDGKDLRMQPLGERSSECAASASEAAKPLRASGPERASLALVGFGRPRGRCAISGVRSM
jgi:hypothetical protein